MNADTLREKFLKYFKSRKHKIVESDSLVPKEDPTVLFTPAGMNQFKREFLGFDSGFRRAATAQRCLRTDDLDKVGKTPCHHTFFEMLGNFSFGDYFKKEAIEYAWEFLTAELKIPEDKLWISVYKEDAEAYAAWKGKIKIPAHKIVKLGDKENFWPAEAKEKGPDGPCGPCSEIFFDFGKDTGCGRLSCSPGCGCARFVEIWNLVFTQFNRKGTGQLRPLPHKNIDTGMGLERLTAVIEGKANNFQSSLFKPLVDEIRSSAKKNADSLQDIYAITDHIRAIVFSIFDGILPSNEGRGYVVRKIIRKSVLHLRNLGIDGPFLNKLAPLVALIMQAPYPGLKDRQEDIALVILNEEKNFINTLSLASVLIDNEIKKVKAELENDPKIEGYTFASTPTSGSLGISGYRLYDTNGIPLEITKGELNKRHIKVNENFETAYQNELSKQKNLSKSFSKMKGDVFEAKRLGIKLDETKFTGYQEDSTKAEVLAVLKDGKEIVLDRTPFYAESGGQVGDTGKLINGKNVFEVLDTQKIDNVVLHIGKISSGSFKKGDKVVAQINPERRLNIARNHTATHILQAALRKVLGSYVQQQGSLVAEDKFRFDFTHFKGLSKEEIARVEEVANGFISQSHSLSCKELSLKEAKKTGALAFFEEKYGENVRLVSIGDISKELCAGTHLDNISKVGLIKIIGEGSVASGIRRIEGVTAAFAEQFIKDEEQKVIEEAKKREQLKEQKEQEKKRSLEVNNRLQDRIPRLMNKGININGVNVVSSLESGLDMYSLRLLADKIKEEIKQGVIALGSQDNGQKKAYLVIAVTQDLLPRGLDAGVLIRQVAPFIGGSGGGRKDFAQAGGNNPSGITDALTELKKILGA